MNMLRQMIRKLDADDGSAAVSFILAFPIFLTIVAIIVQLSLMVNAKIMVTHAADTAARAAVTSLPDGHPENVRHAASLVLAPLSPEAQSPVDPTAAADADALRRVGVDLPETFAARETYAMDATTVSWRPEKDFVYSEGQELEVSVTYRFRLTVPVAMRIVSAVDATVGGVAGRFWDVSAKSRVQTTHGRKVRSERDGWPK